MCLEVSLARVSLSQSDVRKCGAHLRGRMPVGVAIDGSILDVLRSKHHLQTTLPAWLAANAKYLGREPA